MSRQDYAKRPERPGLRHTTPKAHAITMPSLEEAFETSVQDGTLPGAVLLAADKTGTFTYSKAFGRKSLEDGNNEPLATDDVFRLASMTKLMTSIAALQIVERGLINLDDDVGSVLPELSQQKVLIGFDDDEPLFRERKNHIRFQHLLTHSAGTGYAFINPDLMKLNAARGRNLMATKTVVECFDDPLIYEPGEGFQYSCGIDWAGKVIERLTGDTLESFMRQNVWRPLGAKGISFWPQEHPEMSSKLTGMSVRDESTGGLKNLEKSILNVDPTDCFGGQGCSADLTDYMKILHSLLVDDERLLKKESTALMFQPQLTKKGHDDLEKTIQVHEHNALYVGDFPPDCEYDWGIGGILALSSRDGGRQKGTLIWSGLPNMYWFIDREAGLCGTFGTYVVPPGEARIGKMIKLFEDSMYYQKLSERSPDVAARL